MSKYIADIGRYDYGKNIDLPGAESINQALAMAETALSTAKFSKPITDPYVVQIWLDNRIVWDYINGSLS